MVGRTGGAGELHGPMCFQYGWPLPCPWAVRAYGHARTPPPAGAPACLCPWGLGAIARGAPGAGVRPALGAGASTCSLCKPLTPRARRPTPALARRRSARLASRRARRGTPCGEPACADDALPSNRAWRLGHTGSLTSAALAPRPFGSPRGSLVGPRGGPRAPRLISTRAPQGHAPLLVGPGPRESSRAFEDEALRGSLAPLHARVSRALAGAVRTVAEARARALP